MDGKQFRIRGGKKPDGKGNRMKNSVFIALLVLFGLVIYAAFNQPSQLRSVAFSQVISQANNGKIKQIEVDGDSLKVTPVGQSQATEKSYKEPGSSIYEQGLKQGKVELINKPQTGGSNSLWGQLAISVIPVIIIAAILLLMFRSA